MEVICMFIAMVILMLIIEGQEAIFRAANKSMDEMPYDEEMP